MAFEKLSRTFSSLDRKAAISNPINPYKSRAVTKTYAHPLMRLRVVSIAGDVAIAAAQWSENIIHRLPSTR
jgi:hypothetical protein